MQAKFGARLRKGKIVITEDIRELIKYFNLLFGTKLMKLVKISGFSMFSSIILY